MNTQLIHERLVKMEMDGSCFLKSKWCDVCTDKTSGYRLSPKDSLKQYQNNYYVIRTSLRGVSNNYDKQRYEYQRERISCLLCVSMICRLKNGSTSDFERLQINC